MDDCVWVRTHGERRSDSPEGHVGYYDDRETAVRYLE
jgi:hypothetical protein